MNEKNREVLKQVTGWILPGLGLLTLVGFILGGVGLSLLGFVGLVFSGSDGFFGMSFLLGFLFAMFGLIQVAQRFFQLQGLDKPVEGKVE